MIVKLILSDKHNLAGICCIYDAHFLHRFSIIITNSLSFLSILIYLYIDVKIWCVLETFVRQSFELKQILVTPFYRQWEVSVEYLLVLSLCLLLFLCAVFLLGDCCCLFQLIFQFLYLDWSWRLR